MIVNNYFISSKLVFIILISFFNLKSFINRVLNFNELSEHFK